LLIFRGLVRGHRGEERGQIGTEGGRLGKVSGNMRREDICGECGSLYRENLGGCVPGASVINRKKGVTQARHLEKE